MTPEQHRRQEELRDEQQDRCAHLWTHAEATVYGRLVASTWCKKCEITAHAFALKVRAQTAGEGVDG